GTGDATRADEALVRGRSARRMNLGSPISARTVWRRAPWGLLVVALLLSGVGILNLASASQAAHAPVWLSQLVWLGIAFGVALLLLPMDYERLYQLAWPF